MHLFQLKTLLYLSLHGIGFVFCFIAAMGIPGQLDTDIPLIKNLSKLLDILFNLAFSGIPILFFASMIAFYFHKMILGKTLCILSMSLGLAVFISLVVLYKVK
jgi:hypothetical protein